MNRNLALLPSAAAFLALSACADRTVSGPTLDASQLSPVAAARSGLELHPSGFGEDSYAAWKAQEGRPDSRGEANMALYFQKFTATTTNAAGVARVTGVEGLPLSAIAGLSWEHRTDGWCGAGAPRWTFVVTDASGDRGVIHLGCAAAVHTPTTDLDWIKDSYPGAAIVSAPAFGFDPLAFNPTDALTVSALYIIFDEGNEFGPTSGFVYLDNITVNGKIFTSPADNGTN